mmetsp:Transcript_78593/g.243840  ORF Transcript_78593/g.243840 Transcript_78593/m.243840 type:complete len:249 (-) Transcript_78593:544-1290(-)
MKMVSWALCLCSQCWKNLMLTGTDPSAPWIVALGSVDKKQNKASRTAVDRWKGHGSHVFRQRSVARITPTNRAKTPTNMSGTTEGNFGKMLVVVLLPSMLNSTSCPKTHTPPMTPSTSCKTRTSAADAKKVPVTITKSSGWNKEPVLKPMGTTASPSLEWAPRPKAMSATPRIMRKDSTARPVNTWCPRRVTRIRWVMSHPLAPPSRAPALSVAKMRTMLDSRRSPTSTWGWWAGADKPTKMPKSVRP